MKHFSKNSLCPLNSNLTERINNLKAKLIDTFTYNTNKTNKDWILKCWDTLSLLTLAELTKVTIISTPSSDNNVPLSFRLTKVTYNNYKAFASVTRDQVYNVVVIKEMWNSGTYLSQIPGEVVRDFTNNNIAETTKFFIYI